MPTETTDPAPESLQTHPQQDDTTCKVGPVTAGQNSQTTEPLEETADTNGTMKLIVRSPYWGRVLKGKTRRTFEHGPARSYRVIACQAVLSATEGQFWGCCPHHGKRVLELKEYHFADHFAGNWDIYMVGYSVAPTYAVHNFFMVPQNQDVIDLNRKVATQGWQFVGTAHASVVRLDVEGLVGEILQQNKTMGFRYHHVHFEILMNQVFDRETPRSRKAAIEKARTERDPNAKTVPPLTESVTTEPSTTTSGTTATPPIPKVVSNDSAWFSDNNSIMSGQETVVGGSSWGHHETYHGHSHAGAYPPSPWTGHENVHWYPAVMSPALSHPVASMMPHNLSPGMNPAQQMLHHGYIIDSNIVLPAHMPSPYSVPQAMNHPYHQNLALPELPNLHLGAPENPGSFATLQSNPYPTESIEGGEQDNQQAADEKYNEDVATASFSESTIEEVGEEILAPPA